VGCEDPRCDAKRDRWLGEVYPRDSQRELLGLVMVGPHVTDMVEAGAHVLDSEAVH
jgi:pyruvate/2-oxoglutarate dehydrogenase complex dihydrolipoamide dehydrogenase (E3) component